jgi:hypothetical protein
VNVDQVSSQELEDNDLFFQMEVDLSFFLKMEDNLDFIETFVFIFTSSIANRLLSRRSTTKINKRSFSYIPCLIYFPETPPLTTDITDE